MFEVRVVPGHPTGIFRRGGMVFGSEWTPMAVVPKEILNEEWLQTREVKSATSKHGAKKTAKTSCESHPKSLGAGDR